MSKVAKVQFEDYGTSIRRAMDLIGAAAALPREGLIIIKLEQVKAAHPLDR